MPLRRVGTPEGGGGGAGLSSAMLCPLGKQSHPRNNLSPSKDQTVSQVAFRIINDSFVVFKVFLRVGSKLCEHLIFSAIVILGVDEYIRIQIKNTVFPANYDKRCKHY